MRVPVRVIGIGADGWGGLSAGSRAAITGATHLAGGRRHLELLKSARAEIFTITNQVEALVERLRSRGPDERWVVLASGDPLFYGIGRALSAGLSRDELAFEPTVSSMQLAFARIGVPWQDARIASIHGRPLTTTLLPLLGQPVIALFSQDGTSPAAVAEFFLARGLDDYDAWVGEHLCALDEAVTSCAIADLRNKKFRDLNILILRRRRAAGLRLSVPGPPGIDDGAFARPERGPVLLTHAETRAVVLSRFQALPEGQIWDLGAGLGGVAVDLARAFPEREIVAVERSAETLSYLQTNRQRFAAYNIRIVHGEAPGAIAAEPAPAAVFLGGSGGRLQAILELCLTRILPGGCLVATFVGLENLSRCLERAKASGWLTHVTLLQVSHGQPLADVTALAPLRPVWIVRARRQSERERPEQRSQAEHDEQQPEQAQQRGQG